jgi:alkanesulfonate monooxygenase SsuD/methylene tetrahydromethanopterin reductase-like flavin-dependent oxidoreductase (luciferase family)
VRDHVVFRPRPHEPADRTHVDPFVVLAAVAAVTRSIVLGTATRGSGFYFYTSGERIVKK